MLLITCPWCGQRDQSEFAYGGEAHVARPLDSVAMSDEAWGEYVFMRANPKGVFAERWVHASGCRRWFNAVRNTATDAFSGFYKPGEPRPAVSADGLATPSGEPPVGSGNDAAKLVRDGTTATVALGARS